MFVITNVFIFVEHVVKRMKHSNTHVQITHGVHLIFLNITPCVCMVHSRFFFSDQSVHFDDWTVVDLI